MNGEVMGGLGLYSIGVNVPAEMIIGRMSVLYTEDFDNKLRNFFKGGLEDYCKCNVSVSDGEDNLFKKVCDFLKK